MVKLLTGVVGRQAPLPEEVTPFDFAFGLWGWSVTEADTVEVQSSAQLGQGVGVMGEEQAMEIDIDFQGQAIGDEGGGQEIEISQEDFAFIDFGAGEDAAAIIEHVEHGKEPGAVGEPRMGRSIQLPEFADLAALPTFNRSRRAEVGPGVGEFVFHGPATNLGTIELVLAQSEHLAGSEAVGGRGVTAQALAQEGLHFRWPDRRVIATRNAGRPEGLWVVSTNAQVISVEFVEPSTGKTQPFSRALGLEFFGPEGSQDVTNQRCSTAISQLPLFNLFIC